MSAQRRSPRAVNRARANRTRDGRSIISRHLRNHKRILSRQTARRHVRVTSDIYLGLSIKRPNGEVPFGTQAKLALL